ncbi:hypothetical protein BGZ83_000966 [Gryganskiella cystojenkinii]|nr:hypothetical protein BGZ83_000966 [Gryganskiella cystojenkinii]
MSPKKYQGHSSSGCGEYDGFRLHVPLSLAATDACKSYDLVYDRNLHASPRRGGRYGSSSGNVRTYERSMFGLFTCTSCRSSGRARVWTSAQISTEYWFSISKDVSGDMAVQYRVLIHAQKCRGCEQYMEPKLDQAKYVEKTLKAFDLWTGCRPAEEGDSGDEGKLTPPHDKARCHGCLVGRCHRE